MLVGWGGNNGTTVTAAVLANKLGLSWMTKTGRKVGFPPVRSQASRRGGDTLLGCSTWVLLQPHLQPAPAEVVCSPGPLFGGAGDPPSVPVAHSQPSPSQTANYYGSLLQASTVCLGTGPTGDVYVPFRDLLPMVHPNDIVFDGRWDTGGTLRWQGGTLSDWVTPCPPGWDISSLNLAEAMRRAEVLDWSLQEQLWPHMEKMKPRPSIFIPEFIAANQEERADNVLHGSMAEQVLVGWGRRGDAGDAG